MHLSLADNVGDERGIEQDLERSAAPLAIHTRHQLLGDDGLEVEREIEQELAVFVLRHQMEDAIQRLVGIVGMQSGETKVSSLGELQGKLHGLLTPDLADQDHVRRLTQRTFQRHIERLGVDPHLSLGHQTATMLMDELHRIFHRQNMTIGMLVAIADHRRLGGRFTRPGGANKQHQPPLGHRHLLQDFG